MVLARNELARRLREAPRRTCRSMARSSVSRRSSPTCATRSPEPACSGSKTCSSRLPRMVRDLSAELGKQVLVDIEGGDVELDREMIEMIRDPLDPHHPQRRRSRHREARRTPQGRQAGNRHPVGLGAPVGQPDPDRHPGRRPRHRRQEARREGDRGRHRRQGRSGAARSRASSTR